MHDLILEQDDIIITSAISSHQKIASSNSLRLIRYCVFLSGIVLILSLIFTGCGSDQTNNNSIDAFNRSNSKDSNNSSAIPVQAVAAKRGDISNFLMQTTTIEAERQVDIMAKVSGQVVQLPAEEGLRVKNGDLLAQLDEAEIKINYMRSKVTFETDKSVYERSKEMLEKTFIATEDYEAARLQYESSKSAYEAAKLQLEYTSVRAPFDGVVTVRSVELGQRVNVNQALFTIADFNPLRAKIYVPEKDIGRIFEGQGATISVEAQPEIEFKGVVKMVSPVVDPESGTSKITIDITDDRGKLKPGMFASVFITTETHKNTLIIPKRSLVLETDLDQVYIYREGMAHKVNLKLGFSSGDDLEVLEGLQEGDLVVTAGQDGLREGLPIRVPGVKTTMVDSTEKTANSPTMTTSLSGQNQSLVQGGNSSFDPEHLKRMEERMMQNPEIKKEYEKRLKKDPDLKNNPEKKMVFFREMQRKMRDQ
jgi:membrane fusion protein (multidrug efflux system)